MQEFIRHVRDALREELDAINTYDKLIEHAPQNMIPILEEIKRDEINHQGRLTAMILALAPEELEVFNAGLNNEE